MCFLGHILPEMCRFIGIFSVMLSYFWCLTPLRNCYKFPYFEEKKYFGNLDLAEKKGMVYTWYLDDLHYLNHIFMILSLYFQWYQGIVKILRKTGQIWHTILIKIGICGILGIRFFQLYLWQSVSADIMKALDWMTPLEQACTV